MKRGRAVSGIFLSVLGLLLLSVSLLGDFTALGHYESRGPRPWEQFNLELVTRTPDYDSLVAEAEKRAGGRLQKLPPGEAMELLYVMVIERFTHKSANHNLFSNWILWALGKFHPYFAHIRDERKLVSGGHSLLCGQSSFLLLSLANDIGIRSRHVGLGRHVVMEAFYDNDWHLYDPDMEVYVRDSNGDVLSVQELSNPNNDDLLRAAYAGPKEDIIPTLISREDNTFMSYPPGSWFVWKSQVMYLMEKATNYLKYMIPLFLFTLGIIIILISNRLQSDRAQED